MTGGESIVSQTEIKKASIANASQTEQQRQKAQKKKNMLKKRANQNIVWWCSLALSLAPVALACINKYTHMDDSTRVKYCNTFISDFFGSGSFLWIAITLLATSLLELLLNGFKRNIPDKDRTMYNKFIIISAGAMVGAILLFYDNIGTPVNYIFMCVVSIIVFFLFAFSSRIVIYKLVRGS